MAYGISLSGTCLSVQFCLYITFQNAKDKTKKSKTLLLENSRVLRRLITCYFEASVKSILPVESTSVGRLGSRRLFVYELCIYKQHIPRSAVTCSHEVETCR